MENDFWFKRKMYGWGWVPRSWQGWLVTFGVVAFVAGNAYRFEHGGHPEEAVFSQVVIPTLIAIFFLIVVCFKTGEPPRWQWGPPRSDKDSHTKEKKHY